MGWHLMMLACVLTLVTVGAASGDVLVVDDDEGDWAGWTDIQSAVWNATAGDTVRVYNGTYGGNIVVNVSVSIVGNISQECLLLGDRTGSTVRVEASDTTLEALRIAGGSSVLSTGAVRIYSVDGVTVANCSIYDNEGTGIFVHDVDGVDISNCGVYDTQGDGVLLDDTIDAVLTDVAFTDCGLFMTGTGQARYDSHTITGCTVNGNELFYRENEASLLVPPDAGQVVLANCDAVMIRELNISGSGSVGVLMAHCEFIPDIVEFDGCNLSGMDYGVYLHRVTNVTVSNTSIAGCGETGLVVGPGCSGVLVTETAIDGCLYGLQVSEVTGLDVVNCTFKGNLQNGLLLGSGCHDALLENLAVEGSWDGLRLAMSDGLQLRNVTSAGNGRLGIDVDACDGMTIEHSLLWNNSGGGADLLNCDMAVIESTTSMNNSGNGLTLSGTEAYVAYSSIAGNDGNGIELDGQYHEVEWCEIAKNRFGIMLLDGASNLTIDHNAITSNSMYGIYCDSDLENITFLRNNLTGNNNGMVQAYDDGNHTWDDGFRGNWWSDHDSTDADEDGVWDTSYAIDGQGGSEDGYPLRGAATILVVEMYTNIEDEALDGQSVIVFISVTVEIAQTDASIRVFRDDVLVYQQNVDLTKGRNFLQYEWTASTGDHVFRAVVDARTTEEETLTISVIPIDDTEPETEEAVPQWALASTMLFVSFLVVFNLRRFFFPKD